MKPSSFTTIFQWAALGMLLALSGCSHKEDNLPQQEGPPIVLKASAPGDSLGVTTKASIDAWANTPVGFRAKRTVGAGTTGQEHWLARVSVYGDVIFSPIKSYYLGETYQIKGYHPQVPLSSINMANPHLINYTLTGHEDVMVSDEANPGTIIEPLPDTEVIFKHLLAQFRFTVVNDPVNPYPIEKITSLTLWAANSADPLRNTAVLNLDIPVYADSDPATLNPFPLTFGSTYDNYFTIYDAGTGSGVPISIGTHPDLFKAMVQARKPVKICLKYATNQYGNYTHSTELSIPVANPLPGRSYEVRLKFSGSGLNLTHEVTNWQGPSREQHLW